MVVLDMPDNMDGKECGATTHLQHQHGGWAYADSLSIMLVMLRVTK
jgi:hypothetical protein